MFITEDKSLFSTPETWRDIKILPQNPIPLAYLNVEIKDPIVKLLVSEELRFINHKIKLRPEPIYINLAVISTQEEARFSSTEILRSQEFPFISLRVTSTSEAARTKAVERITHISINKSITLDTTSNINHYQLALHLTENIPENVSSMLDINPILNNTPPQFINLINFKGTHSSNIINIIEEVMCNAQYAPVCGKTLLDLCDDDDSCPIPSFPILETFGNMCELHKANAEFIREGKCEEN